MVFKKLKRFEFSSPKKPLSSARRAQVISALKLLEIKIEAAFEARRKDMSHDRATLKDWNKHDPILDTLLAKRARLEASLNVAKKK